MARSGVHATCLVLLISSLVSFKKPNSHICLHLVTTCACRRHLVAQHWEHACCCYCCSVTHSSSYESAAVAYACVIDSLYWIRIINAGCWCSQVLLQVAEASSGESMLSWHSRACRQAAQHAMAAAAACWQPHVRSRNLELIMRRSLRKDHAMHILVHMYPRQSHRILMPALHSPPPVRMLLSSYCPRLLLLPHYCYHLHVTQPLTVPVPAPCPPPPTPPLVPAHTLTGRMLLSSGDRPAHDYASSISMVSSQAAIQRLATTGGAANVKKATELSIKNAQHSTKSVKATIQRGGGGVGVSDLLLLVCLVLLRTPAKWTPAVFCAVFYVAGVAATWPPLVVLPASKRQL